MLISNQIRKAITSRLREEFRELGYKDKNQVYATTLVVTAASSKDVRYEITYHIYNNVVRKVYHCFEWENTDDVLFTVVRREVHYFNIEDSLKKDLSTPHTIVKDKKLIDFNIMDDIFDFSDFGRRYDEQTQLCNRFPSYKEHLEEMVDAGDDHLLSDCDHLWFDELENKRKL